VIRSSDTVGNDAGWHLRFFTQSAPGAETLLISIGAGDYYAKIEAALPSGLEGGTYHFTIEGITNSDYKQLHQAWSKTPRVPILVDLYRPKPLVARRCSPNTSHSSQFMKTRAIRVQVKMSDASST